MNASQLQALFQRMGSFLGYRAQPKRTRPYTGEELREIRKRNGVGRPPAVQRARTAARG